MCGYREIYVILEKLLLIVINKVKFSFIYIFISLFMLLKFWFVSLICKY